MKKMLTSHPHNVLPVPKNVYKVRRFLEIQDETSTLVEVAEQRPHDAQSSQLLFTKTGGRMKESIIAWICV